MARASLSGVDVAQARAYETGDGFIAAHGEELGGVLMAVHVRCLGVAGDQVAIHARMMAFLRHAAFPRESLLFWARGVAPDDAYGLTRGVRMGVALTQARDCHTGDDTFPTRAHHPGDVHLQTHEDSERRR